MIVEVTFQVKSVGRELEIVYWEIHLFMMRSKEHSSEI